MGTPRTIGEVPESSGSVDDRGPAPNELNRKTMKWGARLIAVAAPFVVLAQASRRCISRTLYYGLLVRLIGVCLGAGAAHAQDAIWLLSPGSGNWNTAANWQPTIVPTRTAAFGASNTTAITFSNNTSVGTLEFNNGAPAYTFSLSGGIGLTITGTGIDNDSSNIPTFSLTTASSVPAALTFEGRSAAGNVAIDGSGTIMFFDKSTAAVATININRALLQFNDRSKAGAANITNTFGKTIFRGKSTAGTAVINNDVGLLNFFDRSTAGAATIHNNSGNMTFADKSSAGTASIANADSTTMFISRSTAGNATITNLAVLEFADTSTAGHATITDSNGGITRFLGTSTAALSTITTDNGGATLFENTSTGGHARFIANSGGTFDISNLTSAGITVGSIEGAGTYQLGSKALTVGLNNLNTTVSGTIVDGGFNGGTGGALIKDGKGKLTLSGLNTYSGGTVINRGTLIAAGVQALGTGDVTVNGGLLKADSQPINVKGNYTQNACGTLQLQVAGANPGQYASLDVGGNAVLGGTLQLNSLGFQPKAGNELTLLTTGGVVSGEFAHFIDPFTTGPGFNSVDLVYGPKSVLLEFLNLAAPTGSIIVTTNFNSFAGALTQPVPEPSTSAMIATGGVALLGIMRRKKHRTA